jgi:hypothetical protein
MKVVSKRGNWGVELVKDVTRESQIEEMLSVTRSLLLITVTSSSSGVT